MGVVMLLQNGLLKYNTALTELACFSGVCSNQLKVVCMVCVTCEVIL